MKVKRKSSSILIIPSWFLATKRGEDCGLWALIAATLKSLCHFGPSRVYPPKLRLKLIKLATTKIIFPFEQFFFFFCGVCHSSTDLANIADILLKGTQTWWRPSNTELCGDGGTVWSTDRQRCRGMMATPDVKGKHLSPTSCSDIKTLRMHRCWNARTRRWENCSFLALSHLF